MMPRSSAAGEPIAIVGMALRFPGGNVTVDGFAEFLREGGVGIETIPADRWNVSDYRDADGAPGKIRAEAGGFLAGIDQFDAPFFAISPKEAAFIDPQQRLVLETAWAALEDAGIDPARVPGGEGGVYIGCSMADYLMQMAGLADDQLVAHLGPGTAPSAIPGRLSHFLGWHGPSINVDTACSSSLVTVHLAAQALRGGECAVALAGGVNLIHHPRNHMIFTQANMLSPDGRCRTFDEAADGYGRSEGCGMLVLKRLADAERAGDTVLALISGSSVRQDGASGGLTVPNGLAQADVMRRAVAAAGLTPADITYVEAHGTGTPLGDPIEAAAVNAVFGRDRDSAEPVVMASLKSNIGHMEAAAGVGGMIKTVLQLREEVIYPHVGLTKLSPHIPWQRYRLSVPTSVRSWPAGPRRGLVNSFGFAGTIASVVLEQAPPAGERAPVPAGEHIFTTSAKSVAVLRRQLQAYRDLLASDPDVSLADLCYTSNARRAHFGHRYATVATGVAELVQSIDRQLKENVVAESATVAAARVAFLFTGQGAQYPGMARALYREHPVFRVCVDECDELLQPHLGRSIKELLLIDPGEGGLEIHQTCHAQPALFVLEYALARLWTSWGVVPDVLLGHSIGELVAATVAGLFSLADGVRIAAARGRLMQSASTLGGMAAVRGSRVEVEPYLADFGDVGIAAVNAPHQCVISGSRESLAQVIVALGRDGLRAKALAVSHAFHSPMMAQAAAEFAAVFADVTFHEPAIPFVSNRTGRIAVYEEVATPGYWSQHIVDPVDFVSGIAAVEARGPHTFIEVGPSATLVGLGKQSATRPGHTWLASITSAADDGAGLRRAVSRCYLGGLDIDWPAYHRETTARPIPLPGYPFDRKRYWLPLAGGNTRTGAAAGRGYDLLGTEIPAGPDVREFRTLLRATEPAWLSDHVVLGQVVFPGAGFVELLLAAQDAMFGSTDRDVLDLHIHEPLLLTDEPAEVHTRVRALPDGSAEVDVFSRLPGADGALVRVHATARFSVRRSEPAGEAGWIQELRQQGLDGVAGASAVAGDDLYPLFAQLGLVYGPEFQRIRTVRHTRRVVVGVLRETDTPSGAYLPPYALDAAMQTLLTLTESGRTYLPLAFSEIRLFKRPKGALRSVVRLTGEGDDLAVDLLLLEQSEPVVAVRQLKLVRVTNKAAGAERLAYEPRWLPRAAASGRSARADHRMLLIHPPPAASAAAPDHPVAADVDTATDLVWTDPDITDVVWFWWTDAGSSGVDRLRSESEHNYAGLLRLIQELEDVPRTQPLRIWLVTVGGQWVPGDQRHDVPADALAAGSLWGFGRVLANEYPGYRVTLVDLDPAAADVEPLLREVATADTGDDDFQLAFRDGRRHVLRLLPVQIPAERTGNVELVCGAEGRLADLRLVPAEAVPPEGDQVQVRVHAAGVNLEDVLNAQGVLRGYARQQGMEPVELPLGFECAGTVVAAGPQAPFAPGDEVVVAALGCMRRQVTVPAAAVVRKPPALSFAEVAGLPAVYASAYHALHDLAGLTAGDRVLVHTGGGAVDQAVIQLARLAGAQVLATADPDRHQRLREYGADHVLDPGAPGLAAEIVRLAGGEGVDVVLQTVSNAPVPVNLQVLAAGGRLVEPSTIGVRSGEQVTAERPDVTYATFDLSQLPTVGYHEITRRVLGPVLDGMAGGELARMPVTVYPAEQAAEAFAELGRGGITGRLVLGFADDRDRPDVPPRITADETYLVTGGLGGLGMLAARTLADAGARNLVLVSRRAAPEDEVARLTAEFGAGVRVRFLSGDIADGGDVERILREVTAGGARLGGIVHAAGVLADAPITRQDWGSFEKVFAAKMYGSWQLHQATAEHDPAFFVGYSSATALLGTAGQSNYGAANSFLDLLMRHRRGHGRAALSVNWGPWAEVGMAARMDQRQAALLAERGYTPLRPAKAMRTLFEMLARPHAQVLIGEIDWERFAATQKVPNGLLAELADPRGGADAAIDMDRLLALPDSERQTAVIELIRAKVAAVLYYDSPEDVSVDARFIELGLDSMLSVEFKNTLETALRIPLSASLIFDYPSVRSLGEYVAGRLVSGAERQASPKAGR